MNRDRFLDLECHHLLCPTGIVEGGTFRNHAPARKPRPSKAGKVARWGAVIVVYALGCAAAIAATGWALEKFA